MATPSRGNGELGSPVWRAPVEDEVDAELAFHVEMRTRELIARGVSPDDARAQAIARFGNIGSVNAECRTIGNSRERVMNRTEYFRELAYDARFAVRQLIKARSFTLVAGLTLALGIGATTAIFSAVEAVVLRPFPFPDAGRLEFVFTKWPTGNGSVSVGDQADWRKRAKSFSSLTAFRFRGATLARAGSPERVTVADATADMFATFRVQPQLGRAFSADEDQPGRNNVILLSDAFWRRSLGSDRGVIGQTLTLDGMPHTVIGIMPPSFDPTDSHEDAWVPAGFNAAQTNEHDEHMLTVVARLASNATEASAQRELDAIGKQMQVEYPKTNKTNTPVLQGYASAVVGDYRTRLLVLLAAVSCVLLIACANVANLLLARGSARAKELAIRTAIGAGRSRIVRQLLTESLVLGTIAAAIGLGLAWAGVHLLVRAAPEGIPRLALTRIDGGVLAFTLGLTVVSSLLFGLIPAFRVASGDLQRTLRDGGRTGMASARDRVRGSLVVVEVAIALTLLVGAGLLIRSGVYLNRVDPGFDPRGVLTARVALRASPPNTAPDGAARDAEQQFTRMLMDLRARPGVQAAGIVSQVPAGPGGGDNGLIPEGRPLDIASTIQSKMRIVTPGYLAAMGIPLVAGRDVNDQDIRGNTRVMIISQALAKAAWPHESAIGKRIACCEGDEQDPKWKTIIGVAGDVRSGGAVESVAPEFYLPMAQIPLDAWRWTNRTLTLVARAKSGDAASLTPSIRAAVATADPTLPVYSIASMDERLARTLAQARFHLILLTTLGIVGLLLAAAGIYSVIAYFVTLRTHEIGVRMALGATSADVVRLLTRQGLQPVIVGAVLGTIGALWATRLLNGSLYGVGANDPFTFAAVTIVLLLVATAAILIPARRATTVDPKSALQG